jgi:uncharacterized membrane protein
MTQADIDQAEWADPRNWHGGILGLYHSRRDSRAFVPKRNPAFGVTINVAKPVGVAFLVGILAVAGVIAAVAGRSAR